MAPSFIRAACAGCYICAYLPHERPAKSHPLPAGSRVGANDPLASCRKCCGWVCSVHGTRYRAFECALCNAGEASQEALAPDGGPSRAAAAAYVRDLASSASDAELKRAGGVIRLIQAEQEAAPSAEERRELVGGKPASNLVYGLASVIREGMAGELFSEEMGGEARSFRWIPKTKEGERWDADELGGISIDAIGAAVAATFLGIEFFPRADAERVIHGAAIRALGVADQEVAEYLSRPGSSGEIPIKAPWEVTHPILLDPVMWMILTGYQQQR